MGACWYNNYLWPLFLQGLELVHICVMELGLSTFGEVPVVHMSGHAVDAQRRMAELIQEAKLADEIGLDVFALGEHHRPDYVIGNRAELGRPCTYLSELCDRRPYFQRPCGDHGGQGIVH